MTDCPHNELKVSDLLVLLTESDADLLVVLIVGKKLHSRKMKHSFHQKLMSSLIREGVNQFTNDTDGDIYGFANDNQKLAFPISLAAADSLRQDDRTSWCVTPLLLFQESLYWPTMALDCYIVAKNAVTCSKYGVLPRTNQKRTKPFSSDSFPKIRSYSHSCTASENSP